MTGADRAIRGLATGAVTVLAFVAGAVSYTHMRLLAERHGQAGWQGHAFPISVDGVEIVASLVVVADRRTGRRSGAEATRRYVRRKANITVMEYRKAETPERYPWTQAGISERHYYKLLPRFAEKVNGRYVIDDYPDLVRRITEYLDRQDRARGDRAVLIELLVSRGFTEPAARKWQQRHPPEAAATARPRGSRPGPANPGAAA